MIDATQTADALDAHPGGLLERGLAILELLSTCAEGLPLGSVAEQLRIPRSATHRLLSTLVEQAYVRQESERGTYVLSHKLQVLAFGHLSACGFVDAAQPVLNRLAQDTGELVRLAVPDGAQLTWVAKAQGARSGLRYDPDMGSVAQLSCSATGHAWLSQMPPAEAIQRVKQQGYGSRKAFGPQAPRNATELNACLDLARRQGHAVAVQTFSEGMSAIATAVRHPVHGRPIGVLSVAGPVFRLPASRLHELAPLLKEAAAELGRLAPGSEALMNPSMASHRAHAQRMSA